MIYGKMWTVVRPQTGIPLFLVAVAVGSFAVHVALVTNTPWLRAFLNGAANRAVVTQSVGTVIQVAPPEAAK
jgi:light-harvesting protein B-800-850 alpha chain